MSRDIYGIKRIHGHFKNATKTRNEYVKFAVSENDPFIWYIMIHGIDGCEDEFKGGEYLFKVTAADNFPHEPPKFEGMTPNGVYSVGGKICVSNGEFHKENYDMRLGMGGFVTNLISGIINWKALGAGFGIMKTSNEEKITYAEGSRNYNLVNHKAIVDLVETSYSTYSAAW